MSCTLYPSYLEETLISYLASHLTHVTEVAKTSSVCLFSGCSDPERPSQSAPGPSLPSVDGCMLTCSGLVCGPDFHPGWGSFGDSCQKGPPVA